MAGDAAAPPKKGSSAFGAGAAAGVVTRRALLRAAKDARALRGSQLLTARASAPLRAAPQRPAAAVRRRQDAAAGAGGDGRRVQARRRARYARRRACRMLRARKTADGGKRSRRACRGMFCVAQTIARKEGVRALWSGVGPACIRVGGGAGARSPSLVVPCLFARARAC
jgi:hypothetical protein